MYIYLPHLAYLVQVHSCVTSSDDASRKDSSEWDTAKWSSYFVRLLALHSQWQHYQKNWKLQYIAFFTGET